MLGIIQTWFSALSILGKTGVVTAAAVSTMTVATIADSPTIETKTVDASETIPFETIFENDPNLEINTTKIKTPGIVGSKKVTYEITYADGVETKRAVKNTEVVKEPVKQHSYKGVLEYAHEIKSEQIPFSSETIYDSSLAKGTSSVRTPGTNGIKNVTYKITKVEGKEIKREVVNEATTQMPVTQVNVIGTKVASNCHPSYTPCIPMGGDLDCPDIGMRVSVVGYDSYRLDADNDGIGCDSY